MNHETLTRLARRPVTVLLAYLLLTLLLTQPTAWHLNSRVAGAEAEDALQYTWTFWWFKEAILVLGQLPSNVSVWNWPEGLQHPLLFATPYIDMVGLPVTLAVGPIAAYNLMLISAMTLSAFTAYLAVLAITRQRAGAFLGGLIFAFAAQRWGHAVAGHLPHLTIYWGPLFLWAMWRLVQTPQRRWGLWVGLTAGLTGLVHLMHAAYWLVPVFVVLLLWGGWQTTARWTWLRQVIPAGSWGFLPLVALVGVPYGLFFTTLSRSGDSFEAAGLSGNAADLLAYLLPAPTNPLLQAANLVPPLAQQTLPRLDSLDEGAVYLGLTAIVLAALGLWRRSASEPTRLPWLWLAGLCFLFSLGPFLKVGGQLVTVRAGDLQSYLPLPYAFLAEVPLLSWGRTTARLSQTAALPLAILAALGLGSLLRLSYLKGRLWWPPLLTGGLGLVFVLESLVLWPLPQANLPLSAYYHQQAATAEVEPGGMLDLPLASRREENSALFYQMYHQRPMVGGFIHRKFDAVQRGRRLSNLLFYPPLDTPAFADPDTETRLAALRHRGITTVAVHLDLISKPADEAQAAFAAALLGPPVYADARLRVYAVPPGPVLDTPVVVLEPAAWQIDPDSGGLRPNPEVEWQAYVYTPQAEALTWQVDVRPLFGPATLNLQDDDGLTQRWLLPAAQQGSLLPLDLPAGIRRFTWATPACAETEACDLLRFERLTVQPAVPTASPSAVWGTPEAAQLDLVRVQAHRLDEATIEVELVWRPLIPLPAEPTIFLHVYDAADNRLAQRDYRLLDGAYPPEVWLPEVLVRDVSQLALPPEAAPAYLSLGLYDVTTGQRFPLRAPQSPEQSVRLDWMEVWSE